MFIGDAVGVAARPAARLTAGYLAYTAGVTNRAKVLRPVLILLIAWVRVFLALSCLVCALIR